MLLHLTQGGWFDVHLLYIFMISLANNMDNIGVRIAYSILGIKIRLWMNLWISVITFIISFFAAHCGKVIAGFFGKQASSEISAIILVTIGLWIMLSPYFRYRLIN
jgi:putative Mn2+ efflux pump MntP